MKVEAEMLGCKQVLNIEKFIIVYLAYDYIV